MLDYTRAAHNQPLGSSSETAETVEMQHMPEDTLQEPFMEDEECYFIDMQSYEEFSLMLERLSFALLSNVLQQMPLRLYAAVAYTPLMPHPDVTFNVFRWLHALAWYSEDPSHVVLMDRAESCILLGFTLNQIDAKELVGSGVQHFYGRLNKFDVLDVCIMRTDRTEAVLWEEYFYRPSNAEVYRMITST